MHVCVHIDAATAASVAAAEAAVASAAAAATAEAREEKDRDVERSFLVRSASRTEDQYQSYLER